ncbi:MAG: PIN domain-containing protein [Trueperaceae bacterium]|nr:MAG: PIN domain-containing protein [Trueperaceae bacterium]
MLTAIDTNVISALWSQEPASLGMKDLLFKMRREGGLVICAPVYAELLAYPGATSTFVDSFLKDTDIRLEFELSEGVWLEAAKAFAVYAERRRQEKAKQPKRLLVDFIVGAHALLETDRLLTLDRSRYQKSFSSLTLVR